MPKKIKIGVVGAGVFGAHHAAKFAAHDGASLIGVLDVDSVKAAALGRRLRVPVFDDYRKFLRAVDAVVIAAPASVHFKLAHEALAMGRHTFVEKPLALTAEDAGALVALADKQRCVLQVGHQERYVFAAAGLFNRDRAPLKIDCVRCAAATGRCEDVSVVFDLMVHDLDLIRELTNAELLSLEATGDANEASADIVFANGAIASLKASRCASALNRKMTLIYDDGVIEFDFIKREIFNTTPADLYTGFSESHAPLAFSDPLGFGADQFITAIVSGTEPAVTGHHGQVATHWAQMIEEAAAISLDNVADAAERLSA